MSIIDQARAELKRANFGDEDTAAMIEILEKFFGRWDSGGAVYAAATILRRLIAGKCLSPLTGADDEWMEISAGVFQNVRASSVFKDKSFHDGKLAYDIDAPDPYAPISFPYWPDRAEVPPPVGKVGAGG